MPRPRPSRREDFRPSRPFFAWSEDAFAIVEVRVKGRESDGSLIIGPGCRGGEERRVRTCSCGEFPHGLHETREGAIEAAVKASEWDRRVLAVATERVGKKLRLLEWESSRA